MILGGYASLAAVGLVTLGGIFIGCTKGDVPSDVHTETYTVQAGDTVWGILQRYDTRDNMNMARDWVYSHNNIHGDIQPGQVLTIPVGR
ncbi:LysM peptidoglycan-binding domain-containing protein [Alicyclobacillus dauci]|uniref:LysM peptidoglycan-binding domain-containing protein n=1 Tax=Alicyclobacillus dauci TaxID=1475485 RepID=A0ABY6Z6X5_9BACL|nr:LysM peptidoglycan-binding domain-containing protein [Alicyclobacillus dauci]WAH38582.1 LysM peptidoglycan-binding domain-containing protein [Alicyclobacillus dauci]